MYNSKENLENLIEEQPLVEAVEPESVSVQDEEVELDNYL